MKIKDLDKAVEVLKSIKKIDSEILKIEKFAELVVNGNAKSSFDLKIQNLLPLKSDSDKDVVVDIDSVYDEIRKSMSHSLLSYAVGGLVKSEKSDKKNVDTLSVDLNENETLQFLGLILGVKQRERKVLMDQLSTFGISH